MSGFTDGFNAMTQRRNSDEASSRTKLAWEEFAKQEEEKRDRKANLSKAAEYLFKNNDPALAEMGMHPEDFKLLSGDDKVALASAFTQKQTLKQLMQQLAAGQQDQQADAAFGRDVASVYGRNIDDTLAQGNGPVNPPPVTAGQLAGGLTADAWQSKRADNLLNYHLLSGSQNDPAKMMFAEANLLNAKAAMANATRPTGAAAAADYPAVNGYSVVPDGKGGFQYLRTQPSAQQQIRINQLSDKAGRLNTQIAAYETQIQAGNKKEGWDVMPGETYEQKKAALERELEKIQAELADLKNGQAAPGAPAAAPAMGGDLWQNFMNFKK